MPAYSLNSNRASDPKRRWDKVKEGVGPRPTDLPRRTATDPTCDRKSTPALFPILTVILSALCRTHAQHAGRKKTFRTVSKGFASVLEVDVGGRPYRALEVLIDPTVFET